MLRYLTTAALVFVALASQAQPGSSTPGSGGPAPATQAPIDGGASILLAGGVAYTIRKVQQRRRKTA